MTCACGTVSLTAPLGLLCGEARRRDDVAQAVRSPRTGKAWRWRSLARFLVTALFSFLMRRARSRRDEQTARRLTLAAAELITGHSDRRFPESWASFCRL